MGANGEESLWSPVELLNIASVIDGKLGIFVKQTATVFFLLLLTSEKREREKEKSCCCSLQTVRLCGVGRADLDDG